MKLTGGNDRKRFTFGKAHLLLGRLDLNDSCILDEEFGINLFAELAAAAKEGSGIPKAWSYRVQRKILHLALVKQYPDLTVEEAGELRALLSDKEYWGAITWISSGIETPKDEISDAAKAAAKKAVELLTPYEAELAPQIDALGTYFGYPSVVGMPKKKSNRALLPPLQKEAQWRPRRILADSSMGCVDSHPAGNLPGLSP